MKISIATSLLAVSTSLIAISCSSEERKQQPNILFLFADDWGRYASIYDQFDHKPGPNSVIKTPNIDSMAKKGLLFKNAYVPSPSCTPCRSSILSGQYFYRTGMGAILQMAQWDSTIPVYPMMLKDEGYHIGYTYKVWTPGTPPHIQHGGAGANYNDAGRNFRLFSELVSEATDREKEKEALLQEVKDNFSDFLSDRPEGAPFCYWFGPTNTHRSWKKGSGKDLWGIDPDSLQGKLPAFLPDVHEIREDFADYLGECQAWDAGVGAIIERLEQTGEMDHTIVVISGDHGIPGFPHGKTTLYDMGTEVPLLIVWPEKIKKHRVVDDFVNLMDLAPTFLEAAGVKIPDVMTGRSLMPLIESKKEGLVDPTRSWVMTGWERHVATARQDNLPFPQRSIRTKDYLYIRSFKPERWPVGTAEEGLRDIDDGPTKSYYYENYQNSDFQYYWDLAFGKRPHEELYDVIADPDAMNNLADHSAYQDILKQLSFRMDSVMQATGDPRRNNENCIFDKPPFTNVSEPILKEQQEYNARYKKVLESASHSYVPD